MGILSSKLGLSNDKVSRVKEEQDIERLYLSVKIKQT